MNCAQVKEQLVDFLYGELEAGARTAFLEHLHGCPGCSAEVARHEKTLGHARAALTGPLLQEAPARVRLAVMEAAKAQAKSAKPVSRPEPPGFFARLWRTPWLLPAFGAASVATAVFLVKVLKNPDVIPNERLAPIEAPRPKVTESKTAPAEAQPAIVAEPESRGGLPAAAVGRRRSRGGKSATKAPFSEAESKRKAPSHRTHLDEIRGLGTEGGAGSGRFAAPPPPRTNTLNKGKEIDDLLRTRKDDRFAVPPPETQTAPAELREAAPMRDEDRRYGQPPVPVEEKLTTKKTREAAASLGASAESAIRAAPPPPPPPPAPAAIPAAPSYAPAPAAPAPAYGPKPSRQVAKKKLKAEQEAPWDSVELEEPAKEALTQGDKGRPSLDESVKKADRLFAAQEWSAAAAAYRGLLQRFPSYKDAPKWRERMTRSLVALEQTRAARATKAKRAPAAASEAAKE